MTTDYRNDAQHIDAQTAPTADAQTVSITLQITQATLERLMRTMEFDSESLEAHAADTLADAAKALHTACYGNEG